MIHVSRPPTEANAAQPAFLDEELWGRENELLRCLCVRHRVERRSDFGCFWTYGLLIPVAPLLQQLRQPLCFSRHVTVQRERGWRCSESKRLCVNGRHALRARNDAAHLRAFGSRSQCPLARAHSDGSSDSNSSGDGEDV